MKFVALVTALSLALPLVLSGPALADLSQPGAGSTAPGRIPLPGGQNISGLDLGSGR